MVLEYFKSKTKSKDKAADTDDETKSPVLNADDEAFLSKIASESAAPSNRESPTIILDNGQKVKGKDAQVALMAGADQIPLPASPPELDETTGAAKQKQQTNYWNLVPGLPQAGSWASADWSPYIPSLPRRRTKKQQDQTHAASDLADAAKAFKAGEAPDIDEEEARQEKEDLTSVLDQLNLSATTTRTFSLSKESAKLMEEFTQVLKDVVNGVPTAYDDMDKLLRRRDKEIRSMFNNMPPWLQTLVKSLPAKMATSLAPEVMAATSEKPGADMKAQMKLDPNAKVGASAAQPNPDLEKLKKRAKARIPSLKRLIGERGAVAAILRNILNFLKLRFPAFITGTNVLMSVAVFRKSYPARIRNCESADHQPSAALCLLVLPQAGPGNPSRERGRRGSRAQGPRSGRRGRVGRK